PLRRRDDGFGRLLGVLPGVPHRVVLEEHPTRQAPPEPHHLRAVVTEGCVEDPRPVTGRDRNPLMQGVGDRPLERLLVLAQRRRVPEAGLREPAAAVVGALVPPVRGGGDAEEQAPLLEEAVLRLGVALPPVLAGFEGFNRMGLLAALAGLYGGTSHAQRVAGSVKRNVYFVVAETPLADRHRQGQVAVLRHALRHADLARRPLLAGPDARGAERPRVGRLGLSLACCHGL